jgi:hypothetical protein
VSGSFGEGGHLELWGFDGCSQVQRDDELLARLRSDRRGSDGAFILSHGGDESLWLFIHGDDAFLWFLPDRDGKHPGFVPDGMWGSERRGVRFLQTSGTLADAIEVPGWQLVPVEAAYRAAVEYLHSPERPASVSWFEL